MTDAVGCGAREAADSEADNANAARTGTAAAAETAADDGFAISSGIAASGGSAIRRLVGVAAVDCTTGMEGRARAATGAGGSRVGDGGVAVGIGAAGAKAEHEALRGHAYVWDPWFLVWGLALAAALVGSRQTREGQAATTSRTEWNESARSQ